MSGKCLESVWEVSGLRMDFGSSSELSGKCLERVWKVSGPRTENSEFSGAPGEHTSTVGKVLAWAGQSTCLRVGLVWEVSGKCLGSVWPSNGLWVELGVVWEVSGKCLESVWPSTGFLDLSGSLAGSISCALRCICELGNPQTPSEEKN